LVLVDRAMFRHRLCGIEFNPTDNMDDQTVTEAPAQAGIDGLKWSPYRCEFIAEGGLVGQGWFFGKGAGVVNLTSACVGVGRVAPCRCQVTSGRSVATSNVKNLTLKSLAFFT
jgi:hypothetical protein